MAINWDLHDREEKLSAQLHALNPRAWCELIKAHPVATGDHYASDYGLAMSRAGAAIDELNAALRSKRKPAIRDAVVRARAHCQAILDTADERDRASNKLYVMRVRALEAKLAELGAPVPAEA